MVSQEGGRAGAREVKSRNFAEPRRLSRQRLRRLEREAGATLNGISSNLAVPLRKHHKLSMISVSELNVSGLLDELTAPFVVVNFICREQPAWLFWESCAAVATCETILGGQAPEECTDRRLSKSEALVVTQLLATVAEPVMNALGFEYQPATARLAQEPIELVTLEDWGPDADTQRLLVHLSFDGPGGPSELRLYLPGIEPEENEISGSVPAKAPAHLDGVKVDLHAFLASVDIPLNDLLNLEVGDVIPLGVEANSPARLFVEDRACFTAKWGKHAGHLALRILELCDDDMMFDQPEEL